MFEFLSGVGAKIGAFFVSIIIALGLYSSPLEELDKNLAPAPQEEAARDKEIKVVGPNEDKNAIKATSTPPKQSLIPTKTENAPRPSSPPSISEIISSLSVSNEPAGAVNAKTREALVNILCTTKSSGILKPITASGVIIDPRGIILTNAHSAQYMLLKDFQVKDFIECVIRTGSPAYPKYKAQILFISPEWIKENYKNIAESNPLGTGENDYALLMITGSVGSDPLPISFPYLKIETEDKIIETFKDTSHLIAGYPAGFLGGITVVRELYPLSTTATIKELFTFKETTVDLISLGGTIVSQKGSSGGAVVNQQTEKLVGIIVTTSDGDTTAERDLRAITTSHIDRSMKLGVGLSISEFLSGDLKSKSEEFLRNKAPELTNLLIKAISED